MIKILSTVLILTIFLCGSYYLGRQSGAETEQEKSCKRTSEIKSLKIKDSLSKVEIKSLQLEIQVLKAKDSNIKHLK